MNNAAIACERENNLEHVDYWVALAKTAVMSRDVSSMFNLRHSGIHSCNKSG